MNHNRTKSLAHIALVVVSLFLLGNLANHPSLPVPPAAALRSISEADLRQHEEFLASDELGGRYALSPSNAIAARYLASRLQRYGFRGGAKDGSFFQRFALLTSKINRKKTFIEVVDGESSLKFSIGVDFQLLPGSIGSTAQGRLVFIPSTVIVEDGLKDVENMAGKIAVVPVSRSAASDSPRFLIYRSVLKKLVERDVAGIVLVAEGWTAREHLPRWLQRRSGIGGRPHLVADADQTSSVPVILAFDHLISQILKGSGITSEDLYGTSSVKPLGKELRVRVSKEESQRMSRNVIGILDGRDPQLQHEYVMFSAHFDHLKSRGTTIFNGADDDGSGTSALLEIAQALTIERPRRSVIIMFHTAEELGLLGSQYFVSHPTVPLHSIVVDLNVDMIGRTHESGDNSPADRELSDANTVYLIGSDRLSQELHHLSEQTNRDTVNMVLDYRYNRESHPLRLYYRSDHWNYAKNGIPVVFYFTGIHRDYHKPTDDIEKLDFEKMARITRLIFATGWRIASLDHRLKLDAKSQ